MTSYKKINFEQVQEFYDPIFKKHGEKFCAAPWTSFWTFADGNTASCCKVKQVVGNTNSNTLDEIANSPKLIKLRKEFLEGKRPTECRSCWDREKTGVTANQVRAYANLMGRNTIYQALEHTNEDGSINKFLPTWLDILWTRDCNFSCITCNPASSTSIEKKYINEFKILHKKSDDDYRLNEFDNNADEILRFILEHTDTIEFLHFAGGEPFLQQQTFTLLEKLLEKGLDKKIILHFHTNGSILHSFKGVDIVEKYLKHWGNLCKITLSHDHFGPRGEYIRYGHDENKWLTNYKRFVDAGLDVQIQTTLSIFNIMTIDSLVDWYNKNIPEWHNNFGLAQWPESISFGQINLHEPSRLIAEENIIKAVEILDPNKHGLRKELLNRKELIGKTKSSSELLGSFFNGICALDAKRGTDFLATFPELKEFYHLAKLHSLPSSYILNTPEI
jgi:MoaA/NifB/PqqE/SkfB family radical SAM enzyme